MKLETKIKKQESKIHPHEILGIPAGLVKSHRIIKVETDKEIQFNKLCAKIKLEEFKQNRTEKQRNDRRNKRDCKN